MRRAAALPVRLAAVVTVIASMLAVTPGRPSAAAAPAMHLARQTNWVTPGQDFEIGLVIPPDVAPSAKLAVTVYNRNPSRIEFVRTMANNISEPPRQSFAFPLNSLPPGPGGVVTLRLDGHRLPTETGVYPVRVELSQGGQRPKIDLVTHLLQVQSGPINGNKLDVSWVVPVHASPDPGPDGVDAISDEDSKALAVLATELDANRDLPIVVRPTPATLAALDASPRYQDRTTLTMLGKSPANRQILAGTYVPVSLPALLADGLGDQATALLSRGGDEISAALAKRLDGRTWVENGLVNDDSATFLRGAQVDRLVVPEAALSPNPLSKTLTQPFELAVRQGTHLKTAASDDGLAAHFHDTDDPVLAAHQLLADLAVLYLDAPGSIGDHRGVVIDTPQDWRANTAFLDVFLGGLKESPVLSGVTLDTFFNDVRDFTMDRRGTPLVRTLMADPRLPADAAGLPVDAARLTIARLGAFSAVLKEDNPLFDRLRRTLLVAFSADLDSRAKRTQLDRVDAIIDGQLHLIKLPSHQSITLTASTGTLPVTVLSQASYPMVVSIRLDSDKLSFPGKSTTGNLSQTMEIRPGTNQESFTVRARTAGSFPLHISVYSPNGRLLLTSTTFTVRSTALSGVGLVLSAGAGLFLALWWGRHALKGRRAKRLMAQPISPEARSVEPADPVGAGPTADAGPAPPDIPSPAPRSEKGPSIARGR